jgi:hypothetical protein
VSKAKQKLNYMKRFIGIMSFLVVITVFSAKAQSTTPVVDQRQDNQKDRIEGGVKSGELTRRETRKLAKDQRELKRMERRAKADGEVTNKERARLQQKENQNSRAIRRQKHDAQDRPRANK